MSTLSREARYRRRAAECWMRAQEEDDPILRDLWSRLAAHYQELTSECEDYEARQRAAAETPDAAMERPHHAAADRGRALLRAKLRGG